VLKIVGFYPTLDCTGRRSWNDALYCDALILESSATDSIVGASYPTKATNNDLLGKPDKNDFWVFNPSARDINISSSNADTPINETVVKAGEVKLIDVNGTDPVVAISRIRISGFVGNSNDYSFYNVQ